MIGTQDYEPVQVMLGKKGNGAATPRDGGVKEQKKKKNNGEGWARSACFFVSLFLVPVRKKQVRGKGRGFSVEERQWGWLLSW